MSTVSAGLLKLSELTVSGDSNIQTNEVSVSGAVSNPTFTGTTTFTAPQATLNSTLTGPITASTVNYYDSSGTLAYLNSSLTGLQASVIPQPLQYYTPAISTATSVSDAAENAWKFIYPYLNVLTIYKQGQAFFNASMNAWVNLPTRLESANVAVGITTANVDTVYKLLLLDITTGPAIINVPDTSGLYYVSIQVYDAKGECVCLLNKQNAFPQARTFRILGPNQLGSGPDVIRVPNSIFPVLVRVSNINDPALVKVTAFYNALIAGTRTPPSYLLSTFFANTGYKPGINLGLVADNWANNFSNGQIAMTSASMLPYSTDIGMLNKLAGLNLGPGYPSVWDSSSYNVDSSSIIFGINTAITTVKNYQFPEIRNNWKLLPDYSFLTPITQNYNLQGFNDINFFLGNPTYEARVYLLYGNGVDNIYSDWSSAYLKFKPPSDFVAQNGAFWSVTVYQYNPPSTGYPTFTLTGNSYYDPGVDSSGIPNGDPSGNGRYSIATFTDTSGNGNTTYTPVVDASGYIPMYFSQTPPYDLSGNSLYNNWIPLPSPRFVDTSNALVPQSPVKIDNKMVWFVAVRFYTPPRSIIDDVYFPEAIQQNVGDNTLFKLTPT